MDPGTPSVPSKSLLSLEEISMTNCLWDFASFCIPVTALAMIVIIAMMANI